MRTTALHHSMDYSDGEFLPPLEEHETWGLAWARQLEVTCAWQEAGANTDGEAAQWRDASPPAKHGKPVITMQTLVRANTLNVALRERLWHIANEMSNIAIAGIARRTQGQAAGDDVSTEKPAASPEQLDEHNAQKLTELTRAWFDLVAAAQSGMSALTGYDPHGRETGTNQGTAQASAPLVERRQCVIAVDFADRRRTG